MGGCFSREKEGKKKLEKTNVHILRHINELYNLSWRKRDIEPQYAYFVREKEDFNKLCNNYSIRGSQIKQKLKQICQGYRPARGDGNCFYTAFGYQFLELLLLKYSDDQFKEFIQLVNKIDLPFKIYHLEFKIDNAQLEQDCRNEFLSRIEAIRQISNIENREQEFFEQFRAYQDGENRFDGCFYGLSTIFFRNLSNQVIETSEMKDAVYDRENLMKWETECNSNEVVIQALADFLKMYTNVINRNIQLLFFQDGDFQLIEYGGINQNKIVLLIKPGHYNIGIQE